MTVYDHGHLNASLEHMISSIVDADRRPKADTRPVIRTFDVFDTLIARRCIQPTDIFRQVEERSGIRNFSAMRRQAERNVSHAPHDLDVIYDELARSLQTTTQALAWVKRMEIDIEMENVIPVAENLDQVRHGDVLISDMYLNEDHITSLLDKAGCRRKISLIVTNDGKRNGYIWPEIQKKMKVEGHLGDNAHADVDMPRKHGVLAVHTRISEPSAIEDALIKTGMVQLGQLCRELRLRTWSSKQDLRTVQLIQANLNFPLLVLASVAAAKVATKLNKSSLLFSSRDCDMWLSLFNEVSRRSGFTCSATYFYTSRLTKINPSVDYLEYGRRLITGDALIVDICGTGWSVAHFVEKLGLKNVPVLMLHKLSAATAYEEKSRTPDSCSFYSIVNQDRMGFQNTLLEMSNYSDHAMVSDIQNVHGKFIPILSKEIRSEKELKCIKVQKEVFDLGLSLMRDHYNLYDVLSLDIQSVVKICEALYEILSQQQILRRIYGDSHTEEETLIRKVLLA